MSRIRNRGRKRGPRRGRPILPPVMQCDGRAIKQRKDGTYFIPAGTYRASRITFDRPSAQGDVAERFFKSIDRGEACQ